MKYSSRLTALLLALMMIISSAGAELNTSGLTVDQLNHLYEAASEDPVYEYLPADVLGFETALSVDNAADLAASGYTFQWYEILANGAHCEIVGATDYLYPTEYPLEAKQYYCIYTDPDGIAYRSKVFVITATTTDLDSYLNLLYSLFSDDFGVYDSQKIYEYMTDTWNITLSTGENLAQNVMDYWWSDWSEENRDCDMLCTCVASGKVASDYTILHPNSDAHDPNCYWAKAPIVVSANVSTPDLLQEGQPIVLTSPDAEASYFYWQEYRYNAALNAWEWESVSGGSSYELTVNADSIQAAYRVISNYEDDIYVIPVESRTFFLGGEEFHNWIKTANGILPWLSEDGVTVEQAAAKYSEYLANKDEEDRTNATDYTFTDEDASVNLQVSEDVFAEDYVMEIEAVTPSADMVDAVLKSMDATGTAVMQVLKAFDISFAALEDRTRKLQPSAGQSVALTFEVSTADVPTDDTYYLYVYHIANDGTPEVVAGPVQIAGSAMTIEVQADGFSTYLVMATNDLCPYCVNHEYCVYYYLNGEERENQYELLITAGAEDNDWFYDTTYDKIMLDYTNHMDAGETPILCTCGRQDENGFIYAPNAAGHANGCLWSIYTLNDVGLCGIPTTILVNNADVLAGGYQITWYRNGDVIVGETDTSLDVTPTMEDVTYQWKATHNDTNEVVMSDPVTVIAQHTVLGEYVEYAFNYRNTNEERYILLTDTWNVDFTTEETNGNVVTTVSKNLAEEIISYWYAKCLADPEGYMYYDVFCDCVVSGKLSSHELLLHPDTGHMTDCPWYVEGNDVIVPEKPDQSELYYGNPDGAQYTSTETYSLPMANDRAVILPKGGRAIIQSNQTSDAQWQVYDGTQWIDIQGETATDIVVTDAKLNTVFELTGIAQLRYFDKTNSVVLASVSVTSQEIAGGEYVDPEEQQTLYAIERADEDKHTITIYYMYQGETEMVRAPYAASIGDGEAFTATVPNPTVQGYKLAQSNGTNVPEGFMYSEANVKINIASVTGDASFTVYYEPTVVEYTVIHYMQNVDNDDYTEAGRETMRGLTKSIVPELALDKRDLTLVENQTDFDPAGFYSLLYEKAAIAADGSTIVEVYYDREYFLINFELSGGYGVEPVYARFGKALDAVENPERLGYTFAGWQIKNENGVYVDIANADMYTTMPDHNVDYKAKWTATTVNYTVVYWRENADDNDYSYWGSEIRQASAGAKISGADDVPEDIYRATVDGVQNVDERPYFNYNADKTDKNVVIEGDGSTVVNVYYDRNTYTIYFTGYGKCCLENHTHSAACCDIEAHTHTDSCGTATLICGMTAHAAHTDACLDCEYSDHEHTEVCYINRAWSNGAYRNVTCNNNHYNTANVEGNTYRHNNGNTCVYHNNQWYRYGSTLNTTTCEAAGHTHGDECYKDTLHTHTESCYTYSNCDKVAHTHSTACYSACDELAHTHNNNCTSNNNSNVIYVITAKYQADISAVWPTYDVLKADGHAYQDSDGNVENNSNGRFRGWSIPLATSLAVSKRLNMTRDLCDTSDGEQTATAQYDATYPHRLYYMFESFDTSTAASGDTRKQYNGSGSNLYYDSDPAYFQNLYYNEYTQFGQKQILGMTPVGVQTEYRTENGTQVYINWLYYTRNRWHITFHNIDDDSLEVTDVMYGQPLQNYTFQTGDVPPAYTALVGQKLSAYKPLYPVENLRDLYVFDGWYTTPDFLPGTKFEFTSTDTMPNADMILYAKWVPISRTVEFYRTVDDINGTKLYDDVVVPNGTKVTDKVGKIEDPTNGEYIFIGWFYFEKDADGNLVLDADGKPIEKAIDFNNMAITHDLQVYAKWSSNKLKQYTVYYKVMDANGDPVLGADGNELEIAVRTTGSTLAGMTKTFNAKGGEELLPDYREGYYPVVKSHSLTLNIKHADNEGDNTFTFWYLQTGPVPYTVKYWTQQDDGTYVLHSEKTVSDNKKAVVTETFKVIQGYMPDAYQKRLVVSVNEDGTPNTAANVINFYYTKDTENAYYKVSHWVENAAGGYNEYGTGTQAPAKIGSQLKADDFDLTLDGYEFRIELTESVVGTTNTVVGGSAVTLTDQGLELKLYYVRKIYPYQIRYLEDGTGTVLADPVSGTAKYDTEVSGTPKSIDGYKLKYVNPEAGSMRIRIEEDLNTAKLNIITYYYEELDVVINYKGITPDDEVFDLSDDCGTVSDKSENVKVMSGIAQGATADPNDPTYKFVGWYLDEACTQWVSADYHYTPRKTEKITVNGVERAAYKAATYYAKFELGVADLTITKGGMSNGESAIIEVVITPPEGADKTVKTYIIVFNENTAHNEDGVPYVTISNILIGSTYTVAEMNSWSWRYANGTINAGDGRIDAGENLVAITNTRTNTKWLSDESAVENNLDTGNSKGLNNQ